MMKLRVGGTVAAVVLGSMAIESFQGSYIKMHELFNCSLYMFDMAKAFQVSFNEAFIGKCFGTIKNGTSRNSKGGVDLMHRKKC